ncbi:MAG: hypothetical protein GF353_12445 [Candidatus Lokiarchaeota archaeon]|nr:hypothetical protein [Candidatus Lokiarchaeota archaeon]
MYFIKVFSPLIFFWLLSCSETSFEFQQKANYLEKLLQTETVFDGGPKWELSDTNIKIKGYNMKFPMWCDDSGELEFVYCDVPLISIDTDMLSIPDFLPNSQGYNRMVRIIIKEEFFFDDKYPNICRQAYGRRGGFAKTIKFKSQKAAYEFSKTLLFLINESKKKEK